MRASKFPTFREISTNIATDSDAIPARASTSTRASRYRALRPLQNPSLSISDSSPSLSKTQSTFKFRFKHFIPKKSPSQPFLGRSSSKIWGYSPAKSLGCTSPKPPTAGGFRFKKQEVVSTRSIRLENVRVTGLWIKSIGLLRVFVNGRTKGISEIPNGARVCTMSGSYGIFEFFPQSLHLLKLLQQPEFRKACKDVNFTNTLHKQQFYHWYYRENIDMLHSLQGKSTPLVQVELSNTALTVSFNRTSALNALNIEMVDSLHSVINNATEQKFRILFSSSKALALTTGADILSIFGNERLIPEFYKLFMNLVYKVHKAPSDNLAIMRGLVNAEGASLALACKYRVATPSTVFGFPENGLGSIANSGAVHFLSRLPKPGVGLYILLTGEQITGVDCYLFGLATHYIPSEENIHSFLNELKQSENPLTVLDKYHSTPSRSQSKIYENLSDIEKAYTNVTQIEDIYEKLSLNQTEFMQENVRLLNSQCPLSLKLSLKMFNLARAKNFKQCLSKEYDILMQLLIYRNYNLTVGVHHKLIHKRRGIPPWNPDNLSNVTENMLKPFMKNAEGKKLEIR